jgi:hypothetical protein
MNDRLHVAGILLDLECMILEREGCETLVNMGKHVQVPAMMLRVLPGGECMPCKCMYEKGFLEGWVYIKFIMFCF